MCNSHFLFCWSINALHTPWISRLQDFPLVNMNLTTCKMLILYFENSTFGIVMSWSFMSQKMEPWTSLLRLRKTSWCQGFCPPPSCYNYNVSFRGVQKWLSCSHSLPTSIISIPVPVPVQHCIPILIFPITSIPIPTHSHSNFRQQLYIDYYTQSRELCILCREFKTKYEITAEALLIKLTTHWSLSS